MLQKCTIRKRSDTFRIQTDIFIKNILGSFLSDVSIKLYSEKVRGINAGTDQLETYHKLLRIT